DRGDQLKLRLEEAETISANLAAQANEAREALAETRVQVKRHAGCIERLESDVEQLGVEAQQRDSALSQHMADIQRLEYALAVSRTGRAALKTLARACATRAGLAYMQRRYIQRKVQDSGLFDSAYYLSTYPDVAQAG